MTFPIGLVTFPLAALALFLLLIMQLRVWKRGNSSFVLLVAIVISLVWCIGMLVQPALVWFFTGVVFEMDFLLVQTAVLLSCMPVGISVYVFTIRYRCLEDLAATSIVMSCLMSVFSITLFALLLGV